MSKMSKKTVVLENGKEVVFPEFSEKDITMGLRRRTRNLSPEAQQEEILWILLEENLSEKELEVWDNLTPEEFQELFKIGEEIKK